MHSQKMQVLLADDDIDDCLLFKEALNELPVSSHLATVKNGEQLLQLLAKETGDLPDVLFLDLNMPDIHGIEVIEFVRSHKAYSEIPICVVTTRGDESSRSTALEAGANIYLTKPFTPERLAEEAKKLLANS